MDDAFSYIIDDTIATEVGGGGGGGGGGIAHVGQFLMDVKLFNWTNKKKLIMLKHVVSMVINKAILKNWVYLEKYS